MKQPVLLISFNDVETTKQVLEKIAIYQPARLYFAVDNFRPDRSGEEDKIKQVKALVNNLTWDCEVKRFFPEKNLGPRVAVSSAVTWFFDYEETGIILEHDCLPDISFFSFCEELLDKYKNDKRVMHISGNFFQPQKIGEADYYFSRIPHIWGWATWRRAWRFYDVSMSDWLLEERKGVLKKIIPWWWQRQKWQYILNKTHQGRANTWDYQWTYSLFKNNGLAITPNINLVTNIGFGPGAVHSTDINSPFANLPLGHLSDNLQHPSKVACDDEADYFICKNNFIFNPVKVFIKNLLNFVYERYR